MFVRFAMPLRREDLPADPDQLCELVLALTAENERLRAALKTINTLHFGTKSDPHVSPPAATSVPCRCIFRAMCA